MLVRFKNKHYEKGEYSVRGSTNRYGTKLKMTRRSDSGGAYMKKWSKALFVGPVAGALFLAGCGTTHGGNNGPTHTANSVMKIGFDVGSPQFTDNFNPFSPNVRVGSDFIYESLYAVNGQNGAQTPWLASSYKWNNAKQLTFTIRKGVKWSDGKPFSANDVAFTFNMMKKYPALDANAVWTVLSSVTAPNPNTVVFQFKTPAIPIFTYIAGTGIVPEHIWKNVSNPVTYTDTNPVGTGAFKLSTFAPNEYTLVKNQTYWNASKVAPTKLVFPNVPGNNTADLDLSAGKYTWANLFVPNIQQSYVNKDKTNNHYWFAPGGPSNLVMNLTKAPFNNAVFRQAMEYGINKQEVSTKGEYGYQPPSNATGLMLPGQQSWLNSSYKNAYSYNPKKAAQLLASIGYKKNAKGELISPSGQPVVFNITVPNDFTDWIQSSKVISSNLAQLGITVNLQTPSDTGWYNQLQTGQFDMSLTYGITYNNPWFYYDSVLATANSAPIGKLASSNFERWENPATDKLLTEFEQTNDAATQHKIMNELQTTMIQQVPVIPLFYNANWNEYSTKDFVGWPDAAHPYATPDISITDDEVIMTHLKLAH